MVDLVRPVEEWGPKSTAAPQKCFRQSLRYQLLLFGLHLLLYLKRFVDARRGVANRYWFLVEAKEIKKALLRVFFDSVVWVPT